MTISCNSPLVLFQFFSHNQSILEFCDWYLQSPTQISQIDFFTYFLALGLTCILELPFYFIILNKFNFKTKLLILVSANLLTHPFIYFALPIIFSKIQIPFFIYYLTAETFAPIVESLFMIFVIKINWKNSILTMFIANICSWWVGTLFLQ